MKQKCISAVRSAANGRPVSDNKINLIEDALVRKMRDMARQDRERWQGLSEGQRMLEASTALQMDVKAEAARKKLLAALQIMKTDETKNRIEEQKKTSAMKITQSQAYIRDIQNSSNYTHAIHDEAISNLKDVLDAAESKDGTGILRNLAIRMFDMDNPAMTADIVREIYAKADGHTKNKAAKVAAEAWLETIEGLRTRFNNAGGDVGKLGYGYIGQVHDAVKISRVTAQEWAAKVLPLLDREQYVMADGSLMPEGEISKLLEASYETLASNGLNKIEPGTYRGAGARANSGSESRVIHFKDGDAWMQYMAEFGEGSLYDAMMGHIGHMTKNIGLVERYGPNPETQNRLQADIAERADKAGTIANRSMGNTPEAYWDILSGKTAIPQNETIAHSFQAVRNVQTAAKLGGAVISSFTDVATIGASLHYNRLPYAEMLWNVGRNFTKDQREFLVQHGIIAEHMTSTLNRWTGDNMTHSLTGRVANSVMKLSLMNAWTDGLRSAFSATMMQGFAKKAGMAWESLDEWDRHLMTRKGITPQDWAIISQAKPTEHNGQMYLTRDSIVKTGRDGAEQAATKWMAFVSDEAQFAVVNPDMATRAIVTGGGMPTGTFRGEAMRCFMQFKAFPSAMLTRHWNRVFDTPQGLEGAPMGFGAKSKAGGVVNQLSVLAGLNVSLMMLGMVVLQVKALVQGKDPYDMTMPKFWVRALGQGGGMGFVGDFLTKDPTDQRGNNFENAGGIIGGPAGGAVAGLVGDLGLTNAWELSKGKKTHAGAEALRWVNNQIPYSNLWQTRAMWEHWFLQHAQEAVNPGYLGRMRAQAMKDWQQDYYWQPDTPAPQRAPKLEKVIGR